MTALLWIYGVAFVPALFIGLSCWTVPHSEDDHG